MTSLHNHAVQLAKQYRKLEGELLLVLEQVQAQKAFLQEGFSSLFEYMVKGLHLSESTAYSLQTVIRKGKEVPALRSMVIGGELSLAKAKRIAPMVTGENSAAWIAFAQKASTREIDLQVARANPQLTVERLVAKAENRHELRVGLTNTAQEKLRLCQDLVSKQKRQSVSLEITLESALDALLAKFGAAQLTTQESTCAAPAKAQSTSVSAEKSLRQTEAKSLTPKIKRHVFRRDQYRCTHINDRAERCNGKRFLDIHHIVERSRGGSHQIENLTTLCAAHHRWIHSRSRPDHSEWLEQRMKRMS